MRFDGPVGDDDLTRWSGSSTLIPVLALLLLSSSLPFTWSVGDGQWSDESAGRSARGSGDSETTSLGGIIDGLAGGRAGGIELLLNLTSGDAATPLDAAAVTVRVIDGWSGLLRTASVTAEENSSTLTLSGLAPGSVRLEVEAPGHATGHPAPLLLGGPASNQTNHTIALTMLPLNDSFTVYASAGAVASTTLYLDQHATPLTGLLIDANATIQAAANATGWLHVNGTSGSRLARWDGNASNASVIVDISQSLRLFAPTANGSGSILARHSPSGWSTVISWQDGLDQTLPRIDAGEWRISHLVVGTPTGPDENRIDGPFWDLADWLDAGPEVAAGGGASGSGEPAIPMATLDASAGTIAASTTLNATWSATWTLPGHQGTPLLPVPEDGIRQQVDRWLGNLDGQFDQVESAAFETLFAGHGWLDAEAAGCCLYDKTPMTSETPVLPFDITIEGLGFSTFSTGHWWGWSESAQLRGAGDARASRFLWLPIIGHTREDSPIRVILPEPWEVRHSPQLSLIDGQPGDFTVRRSATGVATDVRVTLGENQPPSISVSITGGTELFLPLTGEALLTATCSDTSIGEIDHEWWLRNGPSVVASASTGEMSVSGESIGMAHGQRVIMEASCTDAHGAIGEWNSTAEIDGEAPSLDWYAFEDHLVSGGMIDAMRGDDRLEIDSTSHLVLDVWANDSSGEATSILLRSNRTEGWQHEYDDHLQIADIWPLSINVNGQHLSVDERHQQKSLTTYWLQVTATDVVGNSVGENRTLTLLDATGPVPRPGLTVDGKLYGPQNFPTPKSTILVNLSDSYDDIDAIEALAWTVALDDDVIIGDGTNGAAWTEVATFEVSGLAVGWHGLTVVATDSKGNVGTHAADIQVWPEDPADPSIASVTLVGATEGGSPATYLVVIDNHGRGAATTTVCVGQACSAAVTLPGGTVDGPGTTNITLVVDSMEVGPVDVRLDWTALDDGSTGSFVSASGESTFRTDISVLPGWIGPVRGLIWTALGLGVLASILERRFAAA